MSRFTITAIPGRSDESILSELMIRDAGRLTARAVLSRRGHVYFVLLTDIPLHGPGPLPSFGMCVDGEEALYNIARLLGCDTCSTHFTRAVAILAELRATRPAS